MNKFEKWHEEYFNHRISTYASHDECLDAWQSCKNEIINLIKKDGHRMVNSYTIIEEIEENT